MSHLAKCPKCYSNMTGEGIIFCKSCKLSFDPIKEIIRFPVGKYVVQMQDNFDTVDTYLFNFIQQRHLGNVELPLNVDEEQLDEIWSKY